MRVPTRSRLPVRSARLARARLQVEALEDRIVPSVNLVESEPNNTHATADVIDRLPATQVVVSGAVNAAGDRDWFRLDLRAGDVFGAALKGQNGLNPALRLVDAAGTLLVANDDARGYGQRSLPRESPLPYTTPSATDAEVYHVISTAGTYFLEVSASGDASAGKYDLDTMVARPALEAQPVGTKQILFLDFDGGTARFNGDKWTMASLADSLPLVGLTPSDESAFIDAVVAGVTDRLQAFVRANGLNGDYSATGVPGQFDIEIRNSRDHADEFGTDPFVSRITVGWTENALLAYSFVGIAEGTDVGNFKTDDQAVVSLNFATFALGGYAVQPPATRLDMIAMYAAWIAAHEFGHLAGCFHTDISPADPFAGTPTVMDKSFDLGVGPDLTFGTADDVTTQLRADLYHRDEGLAGLHDTLNTVAFGLATGKAAALRAAAAALGGATAEDPPRPPQVEPPLAEGLARWRVAGVDNANLGHLQVRIADPGGATLGLASGNASRLDDAADGWGWVIDATPAEDGEFTTPGTQAEQGRTDLLAALTHETEHLLGLYDNPDGGRANDLVFDARNAGERHLPGGVSVVGYGLSLNREPVVRAVARGNTVERVAEPPVWAALTIALEQLQKERLSR